MFDLLRSSLGKGFLIVAGALLIYIEVLGAIRATYDTQKARNDAAVSAIQVPAAKAEAQAKTAKALDTSGVDWDAGEKDTTQNEAVKAELRREIDPNAPPLTNSQREILLDLGWKPSQLH